MTAPACLKFRPTAEQLRKQLSFADLQTICLADMANLNEHLQELRVNQTLGEKIVQGKVDNGIYQMNFREDGKWLAIVPNQSGAENLWPARTLESHIAAVVAELWQAATGHAFERILFREFPGKPGHQLLLVILFVWSVVVVKGQSGEIRFSD